MSLIMKIFGSGRNNSKQPTTEEAIEKLRETEDVLGKKQVFLERKIEQELTTAKKHGVRNKRVALQALRRKKRYEKQLTQIDRTLSTMEYQREALENANSNAEVLRNMGFAAKALQAAHDSMDVEDVHDLMDNIHEQQELAQEISDAIARPVGFGEDADEDELLAELEELEQRELNQNLLDIPGPGELPSVPSTSLSVKTKEEEEEAEDLAVLEAWAS